MGTTRKKSVGGKTVATTRMQSVPGRVAVALRMKPLAGRVAATSHISAAELRQMKSQATERGLRALDDLHERAKTAGITEADVERAIREVRAGR